MSNPILVGGVTSGQSVYSVQTTRHHLPGDKAELPDGRVFRYCRNATSAAFAPGKMLATKTVDATFINMVIATTAMVVGNKYIDGITNGATAITLDQFAGGYAGGVDDAGEGVPYRVVGNAALAATAVGRVDLFDEIIVASTANSTISLTESPWSDPQIAVVDQADFPVGVPIVTIPAGDTTVQYGWVQTRGIAYVWGDEAVAAGESLVAGTGVAGQVEAADLIGEPQVGISIHPVVATEYHAVYLTID